MLLTISHVTMKALLPLAGFDTPIIFYTPIPLHNSETLSNFSLYSYQIISSLWERPYSGREGKHAVVLVT